MATALPLGFGLPVSGAWATPESMVHVARRAEELGYSSLWSFQRVLYPAEGSLDPAWDDAHNPAKRSARDASYQQVHDPLLALAHVASHTERIRLGTATICAPFTPPALLAKSVVTMDHLSGGRFTLGVGIGWMPHEYAAAGVPRERRGPRMEEYLRCLDALLTQDPVEFAGEFYTVPPSQTGPRPVQSPRPPVLVGGTAPAALRRAGRLADGWIPSTRQSLDEVAEGAAIVREGATDAGRDPDAVQVLLRVVVQPDDDLAQVRDDLRGLAAYGVTEAFVDLNFAHGTTTAGAERVLDALAPAAGD